MLTNYEIKENKKEIVKLLFSTKRKGVYRIVQFLYKSGYFEAYGSYRHHAYKGGLAEHSLGVCRRALKNNKNCSVDSIIISALLHDLCKVTYKPTLKLYGHGSKSLQIIDNFIKFKLTEEERIAIKFHMGRHFEKFYYNVNETEEERKCKDLRNLIHSCDWGDAGNYNEYVFKIAKTVSNCLGI